MLFAIIDNIMNYKFELIEFVIGSLALDGLEGNSPAAGALLDSESIDKLNKLTNSNLSLQDYDDWFEGGEGFDKFEDAVKDLLGQEMFDKAETFGDLPGALNIALGFIPFTSTSRTHGIQPEDYYWKQAIKKGYIDPKEDITALANII